MLLFKEVNNKQVLRWELNPHTHLPLWGMATLPLSVRNTTACLKFNLIF